MASASAFTDKTPPSFNRSSDDYTKWKKKFDIWQTVTDVPKARQGGLVVLRLDDDTQDDVLELITTNELQNADGSGIDKLLVHLDGMFPKDESVTAYEYYEELEDFKRPENMSMSEYCREFKRKLAKVKATGTNLSEPVLAFRLLKSANLGTSETQLVKATIDKMTYENMVKQLTKVFSSGFTVSSEDKKIKEEKIDFEETDTMYGAMQRRNGGFSNRGRSRCRICESIYHYEENCPDKNRRSCKTYEEKEREIEPKYFYEDDCDFTYEVVRITSSDENVNQDPINTLTLSAETKNMAVLDSGAPKSVCGSAWLENYLSTISEMDKKEVIHEKSKSVYKFGCASRIKALKKVTFPAVIGVTKVRLKVDVVEGDLPLLLSRVFMKQAESELDFKDDTIVMFGQKFNLILTDSGHYALPLATNSVIDRDPSIKTTLQLCKEGSLIGEELDSVQGDGICKINYYLDVYYSYENIDDQCTDSTQVPTKVPNKPTVQSNSDSHVTIQSKQINKYRDANLCKLCKSFDKFANDYPTLHLKGYNPFPYPGYCDCSVTNDEQTLRVIPSSEICEDTEFCKGCNFEFDISNSESKPSHCETHLTGKGNEDKVYVDIMHDKSTHYSSNCSGQLSESVLKKRKERIRSLYNKLSGQLSASVLEQGKERSRSRYKKNCLVKWRKRSSV